MFFDQKVHFQDQTNFLSKPPKIKYYFSTFPQFPDHPDRSVEPNFVALKTHFSENFEDFDENVDFSMKKGHFFVEMFSFQSYLSIFEMKSGDFGENFKFLCG